MDMGKKFWIQCLGFYMLLFWPGISSAYHSRNYDFDMCGHCHPGGPGAGNFPACTQCHTATAPPYSTDIAPAKGNHSNALLGTSYHTLDNWNTDSQGNPYPLTCTNCHEPHHNNGITGGGIADPSYILAEFTGNYAVTANSMTTMTISDLVVHDSDWEDPATWGSKTGPDRGLVLLDTIGGKMYWYKIVSADSSSITFVNDATYFPQSPINNPQSMQVVYGQFIQDEIGHRVGGDLEDATSVKFGGPHTMAVDEAGTGIDPTPDGVCQVCHTQTLFWRSDGSRANHFSGERCTVCHEHEQGFKAKGGDCAQCHLTEGADTDDYIFGNGIMASLSQAQWQSSGHGLAEGSEYAVSGNQGAGMSCNYCHDYASNHNDPANPFRLVNTGGPHGVNGVCLTCHATDGPGYQPPTDDSGNYPPVNSSVKVDSFHFGLRHSGQDGGMFCWDCHDPHGDSNIYMVHDRVSSETQGAFGIPAALRPVTFTNASTGTDYALNNAPFDGICQVCHTTANHYTENSGDSHNAHVRCTTCHWHNGLGESDAFRRPGPPVQTEYALRARDGSMISLELDMNDTITLKGHKYAAGPGYSPRQTCGGCHDYDAITRAYHFRAGTGPNGQTLSDTWSSENSNSTLYRSLASTYAHLASPGQYGGWLPYPYRQLAAKGVRGSANATFTSQDKPYFFDISSFEENTACLSCHPGGGPAEGIVQADYTVTPYDDSSLTPSHDYDRDFYTYDPMDIVRASFGPDGVAGDGNSTISDDINAVGAPRAADWSRAGVAEADCMLCHIDPDSPLTLQCADGMKVFPNRPRLMIFAERNEAGKVVKISLGTPLVTGLANQTALAYTDDPQRMGRPTSKMDIMELPAAEIGEIMNIWSSGLKQIEDQNIAQGRTRLPYALYGQNVQKIWDGDEIRAEYCANPAGPADEMARLLANEAEINNLFAELLQYMKDNELMPPDATLDNLMAMFFNDFIYAYNIKNRQGTNEELLPIPSALRAYEPGNFYTNMDSSYSAVRDYVRSPLVEGEGMEYIGRTGIAWNAAMYGMALSMQGDDTYIDQQTGQVMTDAVLDDLYKGIIPPDAITGTLHDFLPSHFDAMASAELMGLDFDQDGTPICYVQLVKDENTDTWNVKTYWEVDEVTYQSVHRHMFGGGSDAKSPKWIRVCGQCHVMTHDNAAGVEHARMYNLGMPADWAKSGAFINNTDDIDAAGYDVHMSRDDASPAKMGCGSCHLMQQDFHPTKDLEKMHNFLKGTDTAHTGRNDLDNNYRPKTCERCHLTTLDVGTDPTAAHKTRFGETTARHIENIACQTCHIPFKKTWRFRAFDNSLGYYANLDNRMGYNVLDYRDQAQVPDLKITAYPPQYALSPVYGTSSAYGISHRNMVSLHIAADPENGVAAMDYVSEMVEYFQMTRSGEPGQLVNGMPTNPRFDFWKYLYHMDLDTKIDAGIPLSYDPRWDNQVLPTLYWSNGRNGYPQIVTGNPVMVLTWVDANPQEGSDMSDLAYNGARMLYVRELNAIVKQYKAPTRLGADLSYLAGIGPNDPAHADDPLVGRIILKDSGYIIYDHTGDMYPDIWYVEDVRAVQAALKTVLMAEGVVNPQPMLFLTARYFSDSHGVQPRQYSLGAISCNDCHNNIDDSSGEEAPGLQPGAHRTTDRLITFLPWQLPWFQEANRSLVYNPETGEMEPTDNNGTDGQGAFFIVDSEIAYIEPLGNTAAGQEPANGLTVLGAKASDILELSMHHARKRFYLSGEDQVAGSALPSVNQVFLTQAEKDETYVNQLVNGPDDMLLYMQIPQHIKLEHDITELGIVQSLQKVEFNAGPAIYGGDAFVVRVGLKRFNSSDSLFLSMPIVEKPAGYQYPWPILVKQDDADSPWYRIDAGPNAAARIVGAFPGYVKIKVYGAHGGPGRYAAVWAMPLPQ